MKMVDSSPNGYKTLWKKKKLLVISNFSFSQNVFKRLVLQTHKNQGFFGKVLNSVFKCYPTPDTLNDNLFGTGLRSLNLLQDHSTHSNPVPYDKFRLFQTPILCRQQF